MDRANEDSQLLCLVIGWDKVGVYDLQFGNDTHFGLVVLSTSMVDAFKKIDE